MSRPVAPSFLHLLAILASCMVHPASAAQPPSPSSDRSPPTTTASTEGRWSAAKANAWYDSIRWPVGANFVPSTAINQLEMWQTDTFDPETIDRELAWAATIGMNSMRVYLHDLPWRVDADGYSKRIDRDLSHTAQTINRQGVTIVPLDVRVNADGSIHIRAKDPDYAAPGPNEL